jgi:hypothetical protein
MIVRSRILHILYSFFLVLSLSLTEADWATCTDIAPDEYMDLDFGPVEAVIEVTTREVQFRHLFLGPLCASSFPLGSELSSATSVPLEIAETSISSEQLSDVILRI